LSQQVRAPCHEADKKRSLIFDQAENRLHLQKAVMVLLMGE